MRTDDEILDETELDDEEASLADDVLDEVADDAGPDDLETEGFGCFGLLPDTEDSDEEETEDEELPDEESLEDDAEDVDYDTFDDIDEM